MAFKLLLKKYMSAVAIQRASISFIATVMIRTLDTYEQRLDSPIAYTGKVLDPRFPSDIQRDSGILCPYISASNPMSSASIGTERSYKLRSSVDLFIDEDNRDNSADDDGTSYLRTPVLGNAGLSRYRGGKPMLRSSTTLLLSLVKF